MAHGTYQIDYLVLTYNVFVKYLGYHFCVESIMTYQHNNDLSTWWLDITAVVTITLYTTCVILTASFSVAVLEKKIVRVLFFYHSIYYSFFFIKIFQVAMQATVR